MDTPPVFPLVSAWFDYGVKAAGDNPALVFQERTLSYHVLDRFSNQIAHYLIRNGVVRGDRVGLCLDRSIEMVAVLIGIVKAGAAYVPLDPTYPPDRLAMMEEDARLRGLVAHAVYADQFTNRKNGLILWEDIEQEVERESMGPVGIEPDPEDVVYVMFTSGSTGRPKGIALPHRALSNLIEWQLERATFRSGARVLQYSSVSFDVSFQEIYSTFASGGTLCLISNADRRDPRRLLRQLIDQRIERLFLPYVAMRSLMEAAHILGEYPTALKEINTAGEQLRVDDAVRSFFASIEGSSLDNHYGPTETHVITAYLLEGDPANWPDLPPIGLPLKNTSVIILDEKMQPVPGGESGELYLGGRNLALGYIHRDDLTHEVFIPNPFKSPGRPLLYKTGDLARVNPGGQIEFLGRSDHQIKIRGHRIEPGEINNAAADCPGISECLTHAVEGAGRVLQLASYYTLAAGAGPDAADLREHLAKKLPDYMVPSFLIELDVVPYTPSGKVDFKSLPRPSLGAGCIAGQDIHYESDAEAALAEVWRELLELDGIPRQASFFELGGDSLRAVTLVLKIGQRFGVDLPLAVLAQAPTLAELARVIEGKVDLPDMSCYRSLQIIQRGVPGAVPLFLVAGAVNVLFYREFAQRLGTPRPVYGFQWSGWDGRRGERTYMEMACRYRDELMKHYPEGPLVLGGHCAGGLVAVELARLLKEAGREVMNPLIIWDSPNLNSPHFHKSEPWDNAAEAQAFREMKKTLAGLKRGAAVDDTSNEDYSPPQGVARMIRSVPGVLSLSRLLRNAVGDMKTVSDRFRITLSLLRGQPVPMELRRKHCLWTCVRAIKRHRISRCSMDVLYFRSDTMLGRILDLNGWWNDPYFGFAEICDGRFEAHAVGGGQVEILGAPEVAEIVNQLFEKS